MLLRKMVKLTFGGDFMSKGNYFDTLKIHSFDVFFIRLITTLIARIYLF